MLRKSRWCFKCNYCDSIALKKEADHHEDSDGDSHYDDHNFSDSDLSQSEADSDDGNQ